MAIVEKTIESAINTFELTFNSTKNVVTHIQFAIPSLPSDAVFTRIELAGNITVQTNLSSGPAVVGYFNTGGPKANNITNTYSLTIFNTFDTPPVLFDPTLFSTINTTQMAYVSGRVTSNSYIVKVKFTNPKFVISYTCDAPLETYNIDISSSVGGTTQPSGSTQINQGENLLLTITPNPGYKLKSLTLDGIDITNQVSGNTYTISNIQANHSVYAEFEEIGEIAEFLSVKQNGSWLMVKEIYKKISGNWVLQTDLRNLFGSNTGYIYKADLKPVYPVIRMYNGTLTSPDGNCTAKLEGLNLISITSNGNARDQWISLLKGKIGYDNMTDELPTLFKTRIGDNLRIELLDYESPTGVNADVELIYNNNSIGFSLLQRGVVDKAVEVVDFVVRFDNTTGKGKTVTTMFMLAVYINDVRIF